ncbi:DUF3145 family protein [Rothia sp. ZJ1223]|uniref:DUF3145 family protein n=1 Tax=Rothia sp. ZJ1223 TaxID=2811098 RepID=UPI00195D5D92|nr:DUF3145 family protein [Rothia sp. ZJ1223]MBM7050899.1 DUF3145 family protein [Rothia sp. ZJ1223]
MKHATGGYIFIHAAPYALCPHIVWTLQHLMQGSLTVQWSEQPLKAGTVATTIQWQGDQGDSARFASALFTIGNIFFEVTENATATSDASRFMHTPSLGIFHAHTDIAGNFVVTEEQIKHAYEQAGDDPQLLLHHFEVALGQAWDLELEPLRPAASTLSSVPLLRSHRA